MFRIFLVIFSFLCFINSANATWVVKELKDNQISVYVKGEQNPNHKMMFLFRLENCYQPANYFALNKSSSTEEVPVLVNGQELNLPITKSGKTSLGKEIIFLFNGYNRPDDLINHYSINDKVNLKIKDTDFEESFDVSSIKSVLEDTVRQCYIKANEYYSSLTTFEVDQPEFSSIKKVYLYKDKHIVVVTNPTHETVWEYDPKTKAKKVINHVWNFGALAKKCDGIKPDNIYFAQTKDYYFMGGYSETSPFKIFDLESNVLGIAPSIKYAKNFCKFYEL